MPASKRFFATLAALPAGGLSPLSRYTVANGVLYMVLGAAMLLGPRSVLGLVLAEPGSARLLGMMLTIIGWFYVMGGRTGADSFALATVVDRALVPVVLGGLVLTGQVAAGEVAAFAVLDPLLALGAYLLWRRG